MKIVRHHNYGMALESMPNEMGIVSDKFYFCFFEINNGKTICVHTYESFNDKTKTYEWNEFGSVDKDGNDVVVGPYNITYAEDYTFGEDFLSWHHRSLNTKHNYDELNWPSEDEQNLVIDFYENKLKNNKINTNTTKS